jgi:hypothetical protein
VSTSGDKPAASSDADGSQVRLRWFVVLVLCAAILAGTTTLPWKMGGLVFAVPAIALGVVLLLRAGKEKRGPAALLAIVLGCFITGLLMLSLLTQALLWGPQAQYERCMSRAITTSAEIKCDQELRRAPLRYLFDQNE